MRIVGSILILLSLSLSLQARCTSRGIWVKTLQDSLANGDLIQLIAYAHSIDILDSLGSKYPVYLQSAAHKVELEIVESYKGQVSTASVYLRAKTPLKAGDYYEFHIDNLDPYHEYHLKEREKKGAEGQYKGWWIAKGRSLPVPVQMIPPVFSETIFLPLGCGPESFCKFIADSSYRNRYEVKVELYNHNSQTSHISVLGISLDNELWVGTNMCSGNFYFIKNHSYKIRFCLRNARGEESEWTEWMKAPNPNSSNGN
ncbi:hypothetical protein [Croceimicrobium sp.]|uniref:hypothetical protein n=1 Tax=Croceimicrobium sp. TaxID=2828340 RepID=UPI003BACE79D